MGDDAPWPWHQGKANPRVVYAADQTTVVVCRSAETAFEIVTAVNNLDTFTRAVKECRAEMERERQL
jgi:hypothetical protein